MKNVFCWCLISVLTIFLGTGVYAQSVGLEAHGLYAFEFDGDWEGEGKVDIDDGFGGGASFIFVLSPNFRLDVGADYLNPEGKGDDKGDIELLPLTAALRIGGDLGMVYLYAGGGIGYSFNDITISGDWLDYSLKDCMIYFGCAGAEFELNKTFCIRTEFRYNWLKPELKYKPLFSTVEEEGDLNLNHMQIRIGLALYI